MTNWTDFVKSYAKANNMTYGCALSDPATSAGYKQKYGVKKPLGKKKETESMMTEDINRAVKSIPKKTPQRKEQLSALKQKLNKKQTEKQLVETIGMMGEDVNRIPIQDIAGNFITPVVKKSKGGRKKGSKNKSKGENITITIEEVKPKGRGRPKKYSTTEEARKAKIANTIAGAKRRKLKVGGIARGSLINNVIRTFEDAQARWEASNKDIGVVYSEGTKLEDLWGKLSRRLRGEIDVGDIVDGEVVGEITQEEDEASPFVFAYFNWWLNLIFNLSTPPPQPQAGQGIRSKKTMKKKGKGDVSPISTSSGENSDEERMKQLFPKKINKKKVKEDTQKIVIQPSYPIPQRVDRTKKLEDMTDSELIRYRQEEFDAGNFDGVKFDAILSINKELEKRGKGIMKKIEDIAKKLFPIQSAVVSGASNIVRNPKAVIFGRNDYPPKVRKLISQYGDKIITGINLHRTPLGKPLMTALQVASGNTFSQKLENTPYDKLFHLFMCIDFAGRTLILEKNEVINAESNCKLPKETESRVITSSSIPTGLTLNTALDNTQKRMGKNFFTYSAKDNNCQDFIVAFLKSNNIGDETDTSWVKQETKVLFEGNDRLRKIANTLTDIGARFDVIKEGGRVPPPSYPIIEEGEEEYFPEEEEEEEEDFIGEVVEDEPWNNTLTIIFNANVINPLEEIIQEIAHTPLFSSGRITQAQINNYRQRLQDIYDNNEDLIQNTNIPNNLRNRYLDLEDIIDNLQPQQGGMINKKKKGGMITSAKEEINTAKEEINRLKGELQDYRYQHRQIERRRETIDTPRLIELDKIMYDISERIDILDRRIDILKKTNPEKSVLEYLKKRERGGKGLAKKKSNSNTKMPNKWITYVKEYAKKNNMKYNDALKDPKMKAGYKKGGMIDGVHTMPDGTMMLDSAMDKPKFTTMPVRKTIKKKVGMGSVSGLPTERDEYIAELYNQANLGANGRVDLN